MGQSDMCLSDMGLSDMGLGKVGGEGRQGCWRTTTTTVTCFVAGDCSHEAKGLLLARDG